MKLFRRSKVDKAAEASPLAEGGAGRSRRKGIRRILSAVLLVGVLAVITWPGRRAARAAAGWLDAHVERFSEPGSATYARVLGPMLGALYRRVAEDAAEELADLGRNRRATIVDLGCGPGDLVVALASRLHDARITGLDLSPSMLLWASRHATTDGRLRFVVGDAANLPFATASVDLVVSTLSLHHWTEPADVFAEIARVLRPDGVALIYDLGLLTFGPADMATIAENAGFQPDDIVRERMGGGLVPRLFVRFRLEGFAEE